MKGELEEINKQLDIKIKAIHKDVDHYTSMNTKRLDKVISEYKQMKENHGVYVTMFESIRDFVDRMNDLEAEVGRMKQDQKEFERNLDNKLDAIIQQIDAMREEANNRTSLLDKIFGRK